MLPTKLRGTEGVTWGAPKVGDSMRRVGVKHGEQSHLSSQLGGLGEPRYLRQRGPGKPPLDTHFGVFKGHETLLFVPIYGCF